MPPFLAAGAFVALLGAMMGKVLVRVGLPRDRSDGRGEKPCTMLPERIKPSEETLVSELRCVPSLCVLMVFAVTDDKQEDSVL